MKLLAVISSLECGGSERVLSTLLNFFVEEKGLDIVLVTFLPGTDFYKIHPGIKRVSLNVAKSSKNVLEAVLNNILCILASIFKDVPLLISERNSPERKGIGSYWRLLRKILYPFSDCLIVQNASIAEWFKRKICKARLKVIPNPAPAIIEPHCDRQSYSFIKILAVGSNLSYQKG